MLTSSEKNYQVGAGETDPNNLCRPSALLNFMQDVATTHATNIGLSRDILVDQQGAIWILARLWFRLNRPIHAFEDVTIKTWHRGLKGAMWYRDFKISVGDEHVGDAVNAWVLADVNTHKIKRPSGMGEIDKRSANPALSLGINLSKLSYDDEFSKIYTKTVRYSDLDVNTHINNAKYADLVCDGLCLDTLPYSYLSELQINYIGECVANDEIHIFAQDRRYVKGVGADGKVRFESRVVLSEF